MTLTTLTIKNISAVASLKIFSRALNAITLIILARLLSPSDFGIVAIATLLIYISDVFRDFGVSAAVIQRSEEKEDPEEAIKPGFTIRLFIAIILFTLAFLAAPRWA